jgi:hypothetical protein
VLLKDDGEVKKGRALRPPFLVKRTILLHSQLFRGKEQGLLYRLRQCDGVKSLRGVGIIFATLINHTDIAMYHRLFIGNDMIELADFQRGRVALIIEANGK